ncbi:MAG: hypothetical protein F6K65_13855 [Moorea sp. SIO3C2]|nr:hypothetical protein [Moorena sp. SIO3C2]
MNSIYTVKLIITLIDIEADELEQRTRKLWERMQYLYRRNVIEKVERIPLLESNSSEPDKGGSFLPGILEVEARTDSIPRAMLSVDEKTNGKYKVKFIQKTDDTVITEVTRYNCSDKEFFDLLSQVKNIIESVG